MCGIGKIKEKIIKGGGIFTFLRSIVSSQVASWIDLGAGIVLVAIGFSDWIATPIGAVMGGVVNCIINYRFTFRAQGVSKRAVAVKYFMIWMGSLTLNTVGTSLLTSVFDQWHLLERMGFTGVGNYAAARIVVSLLVSWFWNFVMQKNFVYKPRRFDAWVDGLFKKKTT